MPRRNSNPSQPRTRSRGSLKGKVITAWNEAGQSYRATVIEVGKYHMTLQGPEGRRTVATRPGTLYWEG